MSELSENTKTYIKVEKLSTLLEQHIKINEQRTERIEKTLYGDGNGEKGLNARVGKIEGNIKTAKIFAIPVLGGFIKLIYDLVMKVISHAS